MIIRVSTDGTVRLDEPENLRRFSIAMPDTDGARAGLAAIARLDGRDHAWVDPARIRPLVQPAPPGWAEQFAGMLGFAASKGWTDETGAVRAHIDYD